MSQMPTYMCTNPRCSRTIEVPSMGSYECKICHFQMRPVEAEAIVLLASKQEQFGKRRYWNAEPSINRAITEEKEAINEYGILETHLREQGLNTEADIVHEIRNDEVDHLSKFKTMKESW